MGGSTLDESPMACPAQNNLPCIAHFLSRPMYAVSHTYVPLIEAFVLEEAATNVRYFQEGARWWCSLGGHGQGRGRSQSNFSRSFALQAPEYISPSTVLRKRSEQSSRKSSAGTFSLNHKGYTMPGTICPSPPIRPPTRARRSGLVWRGYSPRAAQ